MASAANRPSRPDDQCWGPTIEPVQVTDRAIDPEILRPAIKRQLLQVMVQPTERGDEPGGRAMPDRNEDLAESIPVDIGAADHLGAHPARFPWHRPVGSELD